MLFKILQCLDDMSKILQNATLSVEKQLEHLLQVQQDNQLLRKS